MKRKCELCGKDKGKRICKQCEDKLICSLCCAKMSNMECTGCRYLEEINQYHASKVKQHQEKHFICELNPKIDEAVNNALKLVENGDIEEGEEILIDLQEEHPGHHTIYFGLGVVHAFREEHDEAIRYFERAVEIFPYFIEAYFNIGIAYQKKFDIGNSVKAFSEVVRIGDPKSSEVRNALDFIAMVKRHIRETNGIDLETYLEAQDRFDHAFVYMERKEWGKALEGFKSVLVKNKRHAQTYGNMGICYGYLGQKEEALACYDKALEIDPTYEPAISNRLILESLKEGETFDSIEFESVEYYRERAVEKRSLKQALAQKLIGK